MLPSQPITPPPQDRLTSAPPIMRRSKIDNEPPNRNESPFGEIDCPSLPIKVAHQTEDTGRVKHTTVNLQSVSKDPFPTPEVPESSSKPPSNLSNAASQRFNFNDMNITVGEFLTANSSRKLPPADKPVPPISKLYTSESDSTPPPRKLRANANPAGRYRRDLKVVDPNRTSMSYDYTKWVSQSDLNRTTRLSNTSASENPQYYIVRDEDFPYLLMSVHCSFRALYKVGFAIPLQICVTIRDLIETAYQKDRRNRTYTNFLMNWNGFVGEYKEKYITLPVCGSVAVLDMLEALHAKYSKIPPCSDHLTDASYHLTGVVEILLQALATAQADLRGASNQIVALKAAAQNVKIAEDQSKARLPGLVASNTTYLADLNRSKTREGALKKANDKYAKQQNCHDQELLDVRQNLKANKDENSRKMTEKDEELDELKKQMADISKLLRKTKSESELFKTKTAEQMEKAQDRWNKRTLDWQTAKKDRDALKEEVSELRTWKDQHAAVLGGEGPQLNKLFKDNAELRARKDELAEAKAQAIKERDDTKNANVNLQSRLIAEEKKRKDAEASLKHAQDRLMTATQNEQHVVSLAVAAALKNQEAYIARAIDNSVATAINEQEAEIELLRRNEGQNIDEAIAAALQKQEANMSRLVELTVAETLEKVELTWLAHDGAQDVDESIIAAYKETQEDLEQSAKEEHRLLEKALTRTVQTQEFEIERLEKEAIEIQRAHASEILHLYQTQEDDIVRLSLEQQEAVDTEVSLALHDQQADITRLAEELDRANTLIHNMYGALGDFVGQSD